MWPLDPAITFLNHGSFGSTPRPVLSLQAELRARIEAEPVRFYLRELEPRLDEVRQALAAVVGAQPADLAFVNNATTGVSTVLASLGFGPGDELITTNHAYPACRAALEVRARGSGAALKVVELPFPISGPGEVEERVLAAVGPRTRLVLLDHVTAPTGLVFPVEQLVPALRERGVETLVDGAHAPGMLPLALDRLGAAYYVGNCHKWLCAPKGVALLHVRRDHQDRIRPLVVSYTRTSTRTDRSHFQVSFDWTGTDDPTAILCLPECLRLLASLEPGGLPGLMARNHALVVQARQVLLDALALPAPAPAEMLGSLAAVPLPDGTGPGQTPPFLDPLQDALFLRHQIEVPVFPWPRSPRRLLRISAQHYNRIEQYRRLAGALREELALRA